MLASEGGSHTDDGRASPARPGPTRWKHAISIWIGMYPVNVGASSVISVLPWWGEMPVPLRSALLVTVLAPLMTFVMMPAVTRALRPWLHRDRALVRIERSLLEALDARAELVPGAERADDEAPHGSRCSPVS